MKPSHNRSLTLFTLNVYFSASFEATLIVFSFMTFIYFFLYLIFVDDLCYRIRCHFSLIKMVMVQVGSLSYSHTDVYSTQALRSN